MKKILILSIFLSLKAYGSCFIHQTGINAVVSNNKDVERNFAVFYWQNGTQVYQYVPNLDAAVSLRTKWINEKKCTIPEEESLLSCSVQPDDYDYDDYGDKVKVFNVVIGSDSTLQRFNDLDSAIQHRDNLVKAKVCKFISHKKNCYLKIMFGNKVVDEVDLESQISAAAMSELIKAMADNGLCN